MKRCQGNALKFPRIQGADICGKIKKDVDQSRVGERVIVRSMQSDPNHLQKISSYVIGSEIDGGFAEYVAVRSSESFKINSDWSDFASILVLIRQQKVCCIELT